MDEKANQGKDFKTNAEIHMAEQDEDAFLAPMGSKLDESLAEIVHGEAKMPNGIDSQNVAQNQYKGDLEASKDSGEIADTCDKMEDLTQCTKRMKLIWENNAVATETLGGEPWFRYKKAVEIPLRSSLTQGVGSQTESEVEQEKEATSSDEGALGGVESNDEDGIQAGDAVAPSNEQQASIFQPWVNLGVIEANRVCEIDPRNAVFYQVSRTVKDWNTNQYKTFNVLQWQNTVDLHNSTEQKNDGLLKLFLLPWINPLNGQNGGLPPNNDDDGDAFAGDLIRCTYCNVAFPTEAHRSFHERQMCRYPGAPSHLCTNACSLLSGNLLGKRNVIPLDFDNGNGVAQNVEQADEPMDESKSDDEYFGQGVAGKLAEEIPSIESADNMDVKPDTDSEYENKDEIDN